MCLCLLPCQSLQTTVQTTWEHRICCSCLLSYAQHVHTTRATAVLKILNNLQEDHWDWRLADMDKKLHLLCESSFCTDSSPGNPSLQCIRSFQGLPNHRCLLPSQKYIYIRPRKYVCSNLCSEYLHYSINT